MIGNWDRGYLVRAPTVASAASSKGKARVWTGRRSNQVGMRSVERKEHVMGGDRRQSLMDRWYALESRSYHECKEPHPSISVYCDANFGPNLRSNSPETERERANVKAEKGARQASISANATE